MAGGWLPRLCIPHASPASTGFRGIKGVKMDDYNVLKRVAVRLVEEQPLYSKEPMDCPEAAIRVMSSFLKDMDREIFCVVNLQEDLRPINMETVSVGVLNGALVHPREVMKSAILSNAASIMLVHNHPSGHLRRPDHRDQGGRPHYYRAGERQIFFISGERDAQGQSVAAGSGFRS